MKNLSTIILASAAILFFSSIAAQNPFWTFPNLGFESGQVFVPLPTASSSPDYTGFTSDYVHAGLKNPHGEIMFFVVDGQVFDRDGNFINELQYNGNRIAGNSEILIINKPGSCTEWYIFLSGIDGPTTLDDELPYVAVFDTEDQSDNFWGSLQTDAGSSTAFPLMGTVLPAAGPSEGFGSLTQGSHGIHFAATKKRKDGSRSVFVSTNYKLYRIEITCEGLSDSGWSHIVGGTVSSGYRTELEIHENDTTGHTRIALPYRFNAIVADIWLLLLETDTLGVTIPSSVQTLNMGQPAPANTEPWIHGVEFSPDGNTVYITHDPSASHTTGLSRYNYITNVLQPATGLSGISGFKNSQIQSRQLNANDYRLWLTNGSNLGTIHDVGGGTFFFNPNVIGMGMSYPVNYALAPLQVPSDENRLHILPDQVDYEDYDGMYTGTCDCCERYSRYDFWDEFDNRNDVFSGTWTDVNNPVHTGETGYGMDTLFVRDTLYIRAGESLTWQNLHVFFAPKAVVVLQRGVGSLGGGELILDNTELTVDQRCFYEKIICTNPLDSCDRKHWEGIRIEGWSNENQALTGFTKQGRLKVYNGSIISHARIGALAGHELYSGYGGGVIDVKESSFLDNETGIKYDPYTRTNTFGVEQYTLGAVIKSRFATTIKFFTESYLPKEFIHVTGNSGLRLTANIYENLIPDSLPVNQWGKGIYMANSRVRVNWGCTGFQLDCLDGTIIRSRFQNLRLGIDGLNSDTLVTRTLYLNHAELINNYIGVSLTYYQSPEILDSDFEVHRSNNACGVYLNGSTGYFVENNTFKSFQTGNKAPWNFGVAINDSRRGYNEIYRNNFNKLTIGGVSQGVNANPNDAFNTGLKWLCNVFDHPILYSDILINTGTISDEQGSCSTGNPVPAGNFFSHSNTTLANHFDLRAHYPGTEPLLDVNYRHHEVQGVGQARLEPLKWTGISGPPIAYYIDECTGIFYDTENTCRTKKTSLPVKREIGGPKSSTPELISISELWNEAQVLENAFEQASAQLDGGNTETILTLINTGASIDELVPYIIAATNGLSPLVIDALTYNGYDMLVVNFEANSSNDQNDSDYVLDNSLEQYQSEWLGAKSKKAQFWRETLSVLLSDTTGAYSSNEILSFINDFEADEAALVAASLSGRLGFPVPSWVNSNDNFTQVNSFDLIPSGTPEDIPALFESGFFSSAGNTSLLNANYIAAGTGYIPYIIPFDTVGIDLLAGIEKTINLDSSNSEFEQTFSIYPNPFSAELIFRFNAESPEYKELRIELFDLRGRRVKSERFGAGSIFTIDGLQLPKGMLTYTIFMDGVPVQNGKVVRVQ